MKYLIPSLLIFFLSACADDFAKQQHYFKDDKGWRVLTYTVSDTNWTKMEAIGKQQHATKGATTVVYFYLNDIDVKVAHASNFEEAADNAESAQPIASYWKYAVPGKEEFKKH